MPTRSAARSARRPRTRTDEATGIGETKYLDQKLDEGERQAEADAVVEDILGRVWQLDELKERGYVAKDLELLELACERYDDPVPSSSSPPSRARTSRPSAPGSPRAPGR